MPHRQHTGLSRLLPYAAERKGQMTLIALLAALSAAAPVTGWLLVEHGAKQGQAVRGLLQSAGFARISTRLDLAGLPRVTEGELSR